MLCVCGDAARARPRIGDGLPVYVLLCQSSMTPAIPMAMSPGDWPDNDIRFGRFARRCRTSAGTLDKNWAADPSTPMLAGRSRLPTSPGAADPSILTIHNLASGLVSAGLVAADRRAGKSFHTTGEFYNKLSFLKGGLVYARI